MEIIQQSNKNSDLIADHTENPFRQIVEVRASEVVNGTYRFELPTWGKMTGAFIRTESESFPTDMIVPETFGARIYDTIRLQQGCNIIEAIQPEYTEERVYDHEHPESFHYLTNPYAKPGSNTIEYSDTPLFFSCLENDNLWLEYLKPTQVVIHKSSWIDYTIDPVIHVYITNYEKYSFNPQKKSKHYDIHYDEDYPATGVSYHEMNITNAGLCTRMTVSCRTDSATYIRVPKWELWYNNTKVIDMDDRRTLMDHGIKHTHNNDEGLTHIFGSGTDRGDWTGAMNFHTIQGSMTLKVWLDGTISPTTPEKIHAIFENCMYTHSDHEGTIVKTFKA